VTNLLKRGERLVRAGGWTALLLFALALELGFGSPMNLMLIAALGMASIGLVMLVVGHTYRLVTMPKRRR
jgi:fatty acid desaturase